MKKRIIKIVSLVMTAALFTQAIPISASTTDIPAEIDTGIYDQMLEDPSLYYINEDGVITEEDLKDLISVSINLDNVKDISCLSKAENLRSIEITGGSITDFSVLCSLKKLKTITIKNNPVKDISCFKDMNIDYLFLEDTNVSVEDKISMFKANDIEIPAGFEDDFKVGPMGMLDTEVTIADNEIAGFGAEGMQKINNDSDKRIVAKKAGETTYSVMYGGKEIAKGNIKVTPSEVKNPQSDVSGIKVNEIQWECKELDPVIITEDGKLYNYKDGKLVVVSDGVKTAYKPPFWLGEASNSQFVLKNDGSFFIDGKSVFNDGTKVSQICEQFALTDDGSLWFINVNQGVIEKNKMCSDCAKIENYRFVTKKDGTVLCVYCDLKDNQFEKANVYEIGKMNIVSIFDYMQQYILDDQGNIWSVDMAGYYSAPEIKLVTKNPNKFGKLLIPGFSGQVAYADADGKVYLCENGNEMSEFTADDIIESNYYYDEFMDSDSLYNKKSQYDFYVPPTTIGFSSYSNDIPCGKGISYLDKSLYITCADKHIAVSDVKQSYGAFYNEETDDYSVLILRNDNTLWEYWIGADTLKQVTDTKEIKDVVVDEVKSSDPASEQSEKKLSVLDLIPVMRYMTGTDNLTDSQIKKYDMNSDEKINSLDIILLKNTILGDE